MTEDKSFNDFLRAKLEEDVEVPPVKAVRRGVAGSRRLAFPLGIAAAALVGFGIFVFAPRGGSAVCGTDAVAALEFLEEAYGVSEEASEETSFDFADRLLAWQDAPYESLLSDVSEL